MRRLMALMLTKPLIWLADLFDKVSEYFLPTPTFGEEVPETTTAEVTPPESTEVASPPDSSPYRKSEEPVLVSFTGTEGRDETIIESIKEKTKRRAKRYFEGKEVKHRVHSKKDDSIAFRYFRGSGKPVEIEWARATT